MTQRKQKLLNDAQMAGSIGYPIRRREGVPSTYAVPVEKRAPKLAPPPVSSSSFKPEPVLAMEECENILEIIRNMVHVMERSPKAFESMGEEDLGTHFLVQLNAQYEGKATGETFNFQRKTDILNRDGDKNVFIAECKFWDGPTAFKEAVDQLLGYLVWRDTKSALIVFVRTGDVTSVIAKANGGKFDGAIRAHVRGPQRPLRVRSAGGWHNHSGVGVSGESKYRRTDASGAAITERLADVGGTGCFRPAGVCGQRRQHQRVPFG